MMQKALSRTFRSFEKFFSSIRPELDNDLLPFFNYNASSGEICVISYARLHPEYYCVIDETFGRNICNLVNVKLIGTISIINEMKLRNTGHRGLEIYPKHYKNLQIYLPKELLQKLDLICQS